MRMLHALTGLVLFAAPLAAQESAASAADSAMKAQERGDDPDMAVRGGGELPAGWAARTDRGAPMDNVKVVPMGEGIHVTLGPAVILYRSENAVSGPFHTLATFTQTKAPRHPEGYGLFFGGRDLEGEGQTYTYFLVRGDGTFLIKERNGAETSTITDGWVAHPAVNQADDSGKATNKLEIDAKASGGEEIRFSVNGQQVYAMPGAGVDPSGMVGFRVNHNLDVHIDGFGLHRTGE